MYKKILGLENKILFIITSLIIAIGIGSALFLAYSNDITMAITLDEAKQITQKVEPSWIRAELMTATVQSSEVVSGDTMHKHMAKIEIVDVTRESVDSNAYHITYKVTAGDKHLENIPILVVSDIDKVTGKISALAVRDDTTLQIRINAIDVGSIHGMISNYHLE